MSSLNGEQPEYEVDSSQDPSKVAGHADPGDATQRNFRYQHSYGAILLIAGAVGTFPYRAVWCEHHEDLLIERCDGLYEAVQVKTRRPELGDWVVTHEPFRRSVKRFVELVERFGDSISRLLFVSNADFADVGSDVMDQNRLGGSPHRFLEAARSASSVADITQPFSEVFERLAAFCECDEEVLLKVLKRVHLVKGPTRDGFDAELAHNHLPSLEECKHMVPSVLNAVRDELVQRIYAASSLQTEDPLRHLPQDGSPSPDVLAKRVSVEVVAQCVNNVGSTPFRFQPGLANLDLGNRAGSTRILRAKLTRGGLGDQIETIERRTLSAEARLMELAHIAPERIEGILGQVVNVVQGECDEASLQARLAESVYGPRMMASVYQRLRDVAEKRSEMVHQEAYECLVGVAGLLTEECKVWWSDRFDPEKVA